uniref:Uncharacterized protein n=1 Tax=Glossina palpalis gambiensis TaxID=67801 RepID=A0A1B0BVD4_9MUSC
MCLQMKKVAKPLEKSTAFQGLLNGTDGVLLRQKDLKKGLLWAIASHAVIIITTHSGLLTNRSQTV